MPYFWLGLLVFSIVVEAFTAELVAIWFSPAALVSMILAFFDKPVWLQILLFAVIGLMLVLATRPLARKLNSKKKENTNADALVGATALVTEQIDNVRETGEVKLNGQHWSARTADDRIIEAGTTVTVKEIHGVKLIVE